MGLFSALFNKEPQEVKNFWKAFRTMYGKINQKNFAALEEACKACPDIWQGPFLLGLAIDLPNEIPADPEKAKSLHCQAVQLAKKTSAGKWLEDFYMWYELPAVNYMRTIPNTNEELALRRLGVAAVNNYENMKPVIIAHDERDDAKFWSKIFWSACGYTEEYKPFADLFSAWKAYRGGSASHDTLEMNTNDIIKATNKAIEQRNKIVKNISKGRDVDKYEWAKYKDMYTYVMASCLWGASPYILDEWQAAREMGGEIPLAVDRYVCAADGGNGPAVRELAYMVFSSDEETRTLARRGMANAGYAIDTDMKMWLSDCAKLGDSEAERLLDTYFK